MSYIQITSSPTGSQHSEPTELAADDSKRMPQECDLARATPIAVCPRAATSRSILDRDGALPVRTPVSGPVLRAEPRLLRRFPAAGVFHLETRQSGTRHKPRLGIDKRRATPQLMGPPTARRAGSPRWSRRASDRRRVHGESRSRSRADRGGADVTDATETRNHILHALAVNRCATCGSVELFVHPRSGEVVDLTERPYMP